MDNWSRRRFLKVSGVVGGAAALAGGAAISIDNLLTRAAEQPLAGDAGVLVLVTLYGGNDGLNTLVPYGENAYYDARPELAYKASDVLKLDDKLGLNPAMSKMHQLWQNKQLAIVRGVGYPNPDHSHFRSMDIWQTASPAEPLQTGWVGRWLDATGDDPLRAVNIGAVLPPLAVGAKTTAAALDLSKTAKVNSAATKTIAALAVNDPADSASALEVVASYRAEQQVSATFGSVLTSFDAQPTTEPRASAASGGGADSLDKQLALVAACIKASVPTKLYSVSLGGFDTHADEKGTQHDQLALVDAAVGSFMSAMSSTPHGKNVVIMIYSEFGRRVKANASQGTDHGTASPMFLAGLPIKGGQYYGDEPSLTDLNDGDLKVTTDFRDVYATAVAQLLKADPDQILGAGRKPIPYLAT
ncbi:MAG: DUF1501 domain-containing protein [Antricoccus sp.]